MSAFEDEFTSVLLSILSGPLPYWEKLCEEIPYLGIRIEMIIDTKMVDSALSSQYQAPLALSPVHSDIKMGLLYLDQVLGTKRVVNFLERKPVALIVTAALISIYRSQWFNGGKVDTCHFLRLFFNVFVTMQALFYNPEFVNLVETNESAARDLVLEHIVKEIDICELNSLQRRELISALKTTIADTVSKVSQL